MIVYPINPLREALEAEFPELRSLGVYNRRRISGSTRWSDHSWGAAWDIRPPAGDTHQVVSGPKWAPITRNTLDKVYAVLVRWKREGRTFGPLDEKIGLILWRVRDHYNHIHVQYEPRYSDRYGTPPQTSAFASWWAEILGEELVGAMLVEDIQKGLVDAGYDLGDWAPVSPEYPKGCDGVWGDTSAARLAEAFANGDAPDLSGYAKVGHSHSCTCVIK